MPENAISFKPEILDEKKPKLEDEEKKEHEEEEEKEEEFSFSCTNPRRGRVFIFLYESKISANDVFVNSQIRPIFPIFNRYLLFGGGYDRDLRSKVNSMSLRPSLGSCLLKSELGLLCQH
ncbi:hypothetical protein SO802_023353 [Lithocarpus litseifolius]|uniref:Uncharacterized protein n=1 Tax=Lithocarpus litseifolius TaxID=425828 RepID=A0AAW2C5Z5_9ROSI